MLPPQKAGPAIRDLEQTRPTGTGAKPGLGGGRPSSPGQTPPARAHRPGTGGGTHPAPGRPPRPAPRTPDRPRAATRACPPAAATADHAAGKGNSAAHTMIPGTEPDPMEAHRLCDRLKNTVLRGLRGLGRDCRPGAERFIAASRAADPHGRSDLCDLLAG